MKMQSETGNVRTDKASNSSPLKTWDLTQANKFWLWVPRRYWQVDFCPYNAHSSFERASRGLRTGNLSRPSVSLLQQKIARRLRRFLFSGNNRKITRLAWQTRGRWLISPFAWRLVRSSVSQSKYNLEFDLWKLDRACPFQDLWESNTNDKVRAKLARVIIETEYESNQYLMMFQRTNL